MPKPTTRDIAYKTVVTVEPSQSVEAAAVLMRDKGVGCVVVGEGGMPVGIITDRDVAVRVVAAGFDAGTTTVGQVMTHPVITARQDERAAELIKLIEEHGIRRVPLIDDAGMLKGIITLDDLLQIVGINVGVKLRLD